MAFYLAKNRHRAADEVAVNWDKASKKLEGVSHEQLGNVTVRCDPNC